MFLQGREEGNRDRMFLALADLELLGNTSPTPQRHARFSQLFSKVFNRRREMGAECLPFQTPFKPVPH